MSRLGIRCPVQLDRSARVVRAKRGCPTIQLLEGHCKSGGAIGILYKGPAARGSARQLGPPREDGRMKSIVSCSGVGDVRQRSRHMSTDGDFEDMGVTLFKRAGICLLDVQVIEKSLTTLLLPTQALRSGIPMAGSG